VAHHSPEPRLRRIGIFKLEGNPEQTAVSETEILLNPEFKKMGIGVLDTGDKCYYEQLFVG
jgi:hypothetical protein